MAGLLDNWSYNDYSDSDIPDSVYTAKISSISETTAKSSGNPMWVLTLALKEAPSSKIFVYQVIDGNFNSKTASIIRANFANMARCFNIKPGSLDINDWIGQWGYVRSYHDEKPDGSVFIKVKFLSRQKGRAELFKAMQDKQAEAFFANSPSTPDFNISNNPFSNSSELPHNFDKNTQSNNNETDDWGF